MKILVTGANGFIGRNLTTKLLELGFSVFSYDLDSDLSLLAEYCMKAEIVFHLAGVNRPENATEYMAGNFGFTKQLLGTLKRTKNTCPIVVSSSIQAALSNPYGVSKKAGEDLVFAYQKETGAKALVYRLNNVFGKWSRPNYNSVVATFCHNIARNQPITVHDPEAELNLVYIDDVITEFIQAITGKEHQSGEFCYVPTEYKVRLRQLVALLEEFKNYRETLALPDLKNSFVKKLYSTYLSYLPEDNFSYNLKVNVDERGSFTEFLKTYEKGQVSVNISHPGITKGNHYHHTKTEKFLVVSGEGIIRFRKIGSETVIEYKVDGKKLEVLDIPPGYTHNIENTGETDMVTIMWVNEPFDHSNPDTFYEEV